MKKIIYMCSLLLFSVNIFGNYNPYDNKSMSGVLLNEIMYNVNYDSKFKSEILELKLDENGELDILKIVIYIKDNTNSKKELTYKKGRLYERELTEDGVLIGGTIFQENVTVEWVQFTELSGIRRYIAKSGEILSIESRVGDISIVKYDKEGKEVSSEFYYENDEIDKIYPINEDEYIWDVVAKKHGIEVEKEKEINWKN